MFAFLKSVIRKILFFLPDHVVEVMLFEAMSFFGRLRSKPLLLSPTTRHLVNMGSGERTIEGFINIDFFLTRGIDYGADLRYPLKINSNVVAGIFCEHTLEHLTFSEGKNLLRECYRILKPGGIIRIAVPDLSIFLSHYCAEDQAWFYDWERLMFSSSADAERAKRRLNTPMEAISFVTQEYGHVSCWDFATLKVFLEQCNFREISKKSFMQGADKTLLIDLDSEDRKFISLYVEAVK
jgi:SAM-dependent methyltransferase